MPCVSNFGRWTFAGPFALGLVMMLAACSQKPEVAAPTPVVTVQRIAAQHLAVEQSLPGRTVAYMVSDVRPQVSGIIQKRLFREGSDVRAGQALFAIDAAPYQAALQSAQASVALEQVARLTTMGELAASIAHEISQPLAAVVSYGNGALRWLTQTPPNIEETKTALKGVVEAGNHAGEVFVRIRDLLKHRKPERSMVDLNEVIRDVLALTGNALRGRSVVIETMLATDLPRVSGDRVQLQQVILNLTMNGADAMNSVIDRPRILRVETKANGDGGIVVTIADSGAGIDDAFRHRIFDPLFTTKPTGMGMGLSISRRIIEAHGGRLWSSPGMPYGTDFRFTIPDANPPLG